MNRHKVELGADHVKSLIGSSGLVAIVELLWNALDAGGNLVTVEIHRNAANGIERIDVIDKGDGIAPDELNDAFGALGNSKKTQGAVNASGREYHGQAGKGRYRALCLCPRPRWETTYRGDDGSTHSYTITLNRESPDYFHNTEPTSSEASETGTRVVLDELDGKLEGLSGEKVVEVLSERFAYYLTAYPDVAIEWDQQRIRPEENILHSTVIELETADLLGKQSSLQIVEWRFKPDGKRLHVCDESGFSVWDTSAGVPAPGIEYTAYVRTHKAREWESSSQFALAEIDPEIRSLVEVAKKTLRGFVRRRLIEIGRSVVEEWIDLKIYPYGNKASGPVESAEREVFDILAVHVNEHHASFAKSDRESKRLTLALLRQVLESKPGPLTKILHQVAALSSKDQQMFGRLLDQTSLSNILSAGTVVSDRLNAIQGFEHILFEKESRKRLLERTQLHRLLVREIWLLDEEFTLATDDDSLRAVLEAHLNILGRDQLAPEAENPKLLDGADGIPDLMLHRRTKSFRTKFEHLVVELKRPLLKLGSDEITQIKKYAFAVSQDERFDTASCDWKFVLLGNSWDDYVENEVGSKGLPLGCIYDSKGVTIWVRTWADVLNDARAKLEFFQQQLRIEATQDSGREYLWEKYPHLLEGRGSSKKKDLAISGDSPSGS